MHRYRLPATSQLRLIVAGFVLTGCCHAAVSDLTLFTDRATWQSASTNIATVSFADLGGQPGDTQYPDRQYPAGLTLNGVTFTALSTSSTPRYLFIRTATPNFIFGAGDASLGCLPVHGPCGSPEAGITVALPSGTTSVGLEMGSFWTSGVTLNFSDGESIEIPNTPLLQDFATSDVFTGFTSTAPIASFTLRSGGLPIIRALSFGTANGSTAPFISPSGVVPLYSASNTVQPGEWISIFGNNLAPNTQLWNGDFPTSLGGTGVTIDGRSAYLWFVSSSQINLQVPDDPNTGVVSVVVTTSQGTATSSVTLSNIAPSFDLLDMTHVAGVIPRTDGSGSQGGGAYDILGPTGASLGYPTVSARAGDSVELFGVGFGPTSPAVPAGEVYSGKAPTTNQVQIIVGGSTTPAVIITPSFSGITAAGLYQINITIPSDIGVGDFPLKALVGGSQTQPGVVISLQ